MELKLKNKIKRGTLLKIVVEDRRVFICSENNKLDITDMLEVRDLANIVHIGRGLAVVKDENIINFGYCFNYHTHSNYSIFDGLSTVKEIFDKCSAIGCMTEHGNLHSILESQKMAQKYGKKPVFGTEVYVETVSGEKHGNHLILLVKNETGKKNLFALVSNSHDNFYKKPHVSIEDLEKYHDGLVCTSACLAGELASVITEDYEQAKQVASFYKSLFGEDYYIELQRHGIEKETEAEPLLIQLAKELDIKIVAANDSHYINEEDRVNQEILLCISTKKKITDPDRFKFDGDGYWYKTDHEMVRDWWDMPEVIANTLEIAEKCDLELETGNYHLPKFPVPAVFTSEDQYLEYLIKEGFKERFFGKPEYTDQEYLQRLEYEKNIIISMGFSAYFLIVRDYVVFAKDSNILVGPGRGSAAGSLVAYCLKITDLNPIKYGLLFERFLNPERISMPDIDMDFEFSRRQEVIEYCQQKYGEDRVCRIVTFGTMQKKLAVRDITRATLGDYAFGDRIARLIANNAKDIEEAISMNPDLEKLYKTDKNAKLILDTAKKMEGTIRQIGIHACGVVISDIALQNYLATLLTKDANSENPDAKVRATQLTEVEDFGLLKMDLLGLKTLSVIGESIKLVNKLAYTTERAPRTEILNYRDIPLDDPYVYADISNGKSFAVFQIESEGMRSFMSQLFADVKDRISAIEQKYGLKGFNCPYSYFTVTGNGNVDAYMSEMRELGEELFERMIAGVSLYRPGPMDYIPDYLKNMNSPDKITYDVPQLEKILQPTYGVIVYQEQVMQIVRELAGFSMGQADTIRKAMGKKKQDILDEYKPYFLYGSGNKVDSHTGQPLGIVGCINNGIPEDIAVRIWDKMSDFAKYAFNKSHAATYSVLTIVCAWLKYYYPEIYMCSTINTYIKENKKLKGYISVTKNMGINILPPTINQSNGLFSVEGNDIRFGFAGLNGLSKCVKYIEAERKKNGIYKGYQDFVNRTISSINKKATTSLVLTGCFDEFPASRKAKIEALPSIMAEAKKRKDDEDSGQMSLFSTILTDYPIPDMPEYSKKEKLKLEKDNSGMYISEHPLDEYSEMLKTLNVTETGLLVDDDGEVSTGKVSVAGMITDYTVRYTKKDNRAMCSLVIEDRSGQIKGVIFPDDYDSYYHLIEKNKIVYIKGEVQNDENFGVQLICKSISSIENATEDTVKKVIVTTLSVEQVMAVDSILDSYPGDIPVYAYYQGMLKHFKKSVNPVSSLFMELQNICGNANVKFQT